MLYLLAGAGVVLLISAAIKGSMTIWEWLLLVVVAWMIGLMLIIIYINWYQIPVPITFR